MKLYEIIIYENNAPLSQPAGFVFPCRYKKFNNYYIFKDHLCYASMARTLAAAKASSSVVCNCLDHYAVVIPLHKSQGRQYIHKVTIPTWGKMYIHYAVCKIIFTLSQEAYCPQAVCRLQACVVNSKFLNNNKFK